MLFIIQFIGEYMETIVKIVVAILVITLTIIVNYYVVSNKNINSNNKKRFLIMELSAMAGFVFGSYLFGLF